MPLKLGVKSEKLQQIEMIEHIKPTLGQPKVAQA